MSSFGVSEDFFSYVDKHRAALLCSLRVFEESKKREQSYKETNHLQNKITSSQVLEAIENVILEVVKSLSRNEAPYLTFDKRSNWENIEFTDCVGLQMIPHCTTRRVKSDCPKSAQRFALILKILSMIYKMVQNNSYATKRDIFYTDVQLFGTQSVVDNIVNDISCMLKMPRRSLHVLSTSKGCIAGDLCYSEEDGTQVNCRSNSMAVLVPSNVHGIKNLTSDAKFILIIEKDATFQRLLDDEFCSKITPCIIITGVNMYNSFWIAPCISPALDTCFIYLYVQQGKGVPDLNTRLFVRKLWDTFHIPIFTLVDADPHGIEIMCIYKYGSLSMSFEAHSLTVPAVRWIGLFPSDIERLNIPKDALIPLTQLDQKKLANMQKRPYIACQPLWKREMELMAATKMKAEIQALTSLSADYLTRVYLPNKLQFGGWI